MTYLKVLFKIIALKEVVKQEKRIGEVVRVSFINFF
tara:strand:- start:1082 stop:1189 length:108 start_codon:yes stop_codon:yes gene_type:complete